MKYVRWIFLVLAISGCDSAGTPAQSTANVVTDPSPTASPDPSPSPSVSPSPDPSPSPSASPSPEPSASPSPSPSPSATPYACAVGGDTRVHCSDNVTSFTSASTGYVSVAVGDLIACGLQDGQGVPADCANFTDGGCTNPPIDAALYCWSRTDSTETLVTVYAPNSGYSHAGYQVGPLSITDVGTGGQVCSTISAYYEGVPAAPAHQFDFFSHEQTCGMTVGGTWNWRVVP